MSKESNMVGEEASGHTEMKALSFDDKPAKEGRVAVGSICHLMPRRLPILEISVPKLPVSFISNSSC